MRVQQPEFVFGGHLSFIIGYGYDDVIPAKYVHYCPAHRPDRTRLDFEGLPTKSANADDEEEEVGEEEEVDEEEEAEVEKPPPPMPVEKPKGV